MHRYLLLFILLSSSAPSFNLAASPNSLLSQHPPAKSPPATSSPPKSGSSPSSSSFPSTTFLSTLRSTIDEIQKLMTLVSTFSGGIGIGGDLRLNSAITDCLDLLDLSSEELTWTLSSSQPSITTTASFSGAGDRSPSNHGTGNRHSDVHSWMSAALSNQETCKESLDGTNGILGSIVAEGLQLISSLVANGLQEVAYAGGGGVGGGAGGKRRLMEFPAWVSAGDRRLLQVPAASVADAVVAQDGSGGFKTVQAAVEAAPTESEKRFVIYVKKGVYKENVEVKKKKWNVMMVGDGMGQTVISGSRNFVDGWTTYRSATLAVAGKGFIARDLTIDNTAGQSNHQAVALRSDSDLSVYYHCSFSGYQDTLYAHSLRQFYRECTISGTVDFIFGNAAAVYQNCKLLSRVPLPSQKNSITAQGRKDPNQNTGFSFQFCNVTADSDLVGSINQTATYLGRPWKEYSRTVFMQSYLGSLIRPEGWLEWSGEFALKTLYYGEYMNSGPGSGLGGRVKWPGYHAITDAATAVNFTVVQFIGGDMWLPSTGVKYTAGLTM